MSADASAMLAGWQCSKHELAVRVERYAASIGKPVNEVMLSLLHSLLLFTERAEEVFHQTPFEEGAILIDPSHFEAGKLADLGVGVLGSGHWAFFLIKIDEHLYLVTDVHVFSYITLGQKDFTLFSTVEVKSEINGLYNSEGVVVSKGEHINPSLR